MDWIWTNIDGIVKTIGAIVTAAVTLNKLYTVGKGFQSRATIKRDLELLKMLDETDPSRAVLKASLDRLIQEVYAPPAPSLWKRLPSPKDLKAFLATLAENIWRKIPKPLNWGMFFLGWGFFIFFSLWTADINLETFSWWSLLTGFFALCGIIWIIVSYDEKSLPREGATRADTYSGSAVDQPEPSGKTVPTLAAGLKTPRNLTVVC